MLCADTWPIGVCSWSLKNEFDLLERLRKETGLNRLHLDINPALEDPEYIRSVQERGWEVAAAMIAFPQEDYSTLESIRLSGGIIPDDCWHSNCDRVLKAVALTAAHEIPFLEFHFGFIDSHDPDHSIKLRDRIRTLADSAAAEGVLLLMETGQETAEELAAFLEWLDHPALAVNFDPGNMLLYGKGNPVAALDVLSPWIRNIHAKDAAASQVQGEWGTEMPWGRGEVDTDAFLRALRRISFSGSLCIEREAGDSRYQDIAGAVRRLEAYSGDSES